MTRIRPRTKIGDLLGLYLHISNAGVRPDLDGESDSDIAR